MKKTKYYGNLKLVGVKKDNGKEKVIDYFIITERNERFYAFSKAYTHKTYNMCKAGIRIEDLKTKKTKDFGVSRLVKYTNYIMNYLIEYYELNVA